MSFIITKMSGKKETFDERKARHSLERAGVPEQKQDAIIAAVYQRKPKTTRELHSFISALLKKQQPALAARYNLKRALIALGPAGFPFEQFIAFLFTKMGYQTLLNQITAGACVEHEIDIIATNKDQHLLIECKFHNRLGITSDLKVPLYVKARFDDIKQAAKKREPRITAHDLLIATNTRFTRPAKQYANCMGIQLLSWKSPKKKSLPQLIDTYDIHPITALSTLKRHHARKLIQQQVVSCSQLLNKQKSLKILHLSTAETEQVLQEAERVCSLAKQHAHTKTSI